jgi:hypothetical protein
MSEWMGFIDGDPITMNKCCNCNRRDVIQQTLEGGWLCKKCWDIWMNEPTAILSIEQKCEMCGREGDTPRYFLRNGGHRTCCSGCFVKEFGELPIKVDEIENVHGQIELLPHNPEKVR